MISPASPGARPGRGFNWRDNSDYANELLVFVREIAVFTFERSGGFSALAVVAMLALAAPGGAAMAQTQGGLIQLSQAVTNFKANPEQLLTQFPNAGVELTSRARDFALNDPTSLDPLIALLAKASKDQKTAIAAGLAQAARIVVRSNQPYATRIQQAIADTKDLDTVMAFAAASGDTGTAATGAGGAGSAGASGGQTSAIGATGARAGALEAINGNSVNTGIFSFTSSVSSSGNTTTGTTTGTGTTLISTVTP
ncbi:MAG: hypothetical protein ACI4XG_12210 [Bradyrhizobium sp.]